MPELRKDPVTGRSVIISTERQKRPSDFRVERPACSPFSDETADFYHRHLELMPKVTKMAGFEWGTGLYINPTSPEEATSVLRACNVGM